MHPTGHKNNDDYHHYHCTDCTANYPPGRSIYYTEQVKISGNSPVNKILKSLKITFKETVKFILGC